MTLNWMLQIVLWTGWLLGPPFAASSEQQNPTFQLPAYGTASTEVGSELNASPKSLTIVMGSAHSLRLTDKAGNSVSDVVWTIDDPAVAQVQSGGRDSVIGLSAGRATLTAMWQGHTATVQVRVLGSISVGNTATSTSGSSEDVATADSGYQDPFKAKLASAREGDAEWHYNRGLDFFAMGNFEQAYQEYSEAIRLKPNFAEAQTKLAYTLWRLLAFENAIAAAKKALEMDPRNAEAEKTFGLSLAELGDWNGAVMHYYR
ncbi:MAG TPA: tetratricopeptide repeat protein, partial [Anaerolineales bacterium]